MLDDAVTRYPNDKQYLAYRSNMRLKQRKVNKVHATQRRPRTMPHCYSSTQHNLNNLLID